MPAIADSPGNVKYKGIGIKGAQNGQKTQIVPQWLLAVCFFVSFALPNLVFSGRYWFDTLHIMKWTVTMVPIGILTLVTGVTLAARPLSSLDFTLDPFGALWLFLVLFVTAQPFFTPMTSYSTFAKEWFYFSCLFAVYMLAYNACKSAKLHRALLWGGNVNAAINVLFAEMLMKGWNKGFHFILDVPGNYIGNTAQQEMFGLWTAMSVLNGIYLHLQYVALRGENEKLSDRPGLLALISLNLFFLAANSWGLWNSTARGGILSLLVAFVFLVTGLWRSGYSASIKRSYRLFGVLIFLLAVTLASGPLLGIGRGSALVTKMMDMIQNPTSIGSRISIWRTSFEVFKMRPIAGVGMGHYKWHFLEGQRALYGKHPELLDDSDYEWQFTYWAHSEYIQWLCETGIIGAALLAAMGAWWLYSFAMALIQKKELPPEALWGSAMLFLLWFDALFSRPFHRIENSIWMALAFAVANRSLLPQRLKWTAVDSAWVYRAFGAFIAAVSIYGFVFLAGGIQGDKMIFDSLARPSTFREKDNLLKRAEKNLMSRDDAREQYAYLLVELGVVQKDSEVFMSGISGLYEAFLRRPTSKLLFELTDYSRQIGNSDLFGVLSTYLNPDMVQRFQADVSEEQEE
ncbi:MAG: O-antigen ligase family protein [Synergistaceae bacterium]|jgi:O-antigen ligase|nr:O-antigen ligase family protein [Synergistaceae bacterium]